MELSQLHLGTTLAATSLVVLWPHLLIAIGNEGGA
jgi:hypothetical protein